MMFMKVHQPPGRNRFTKRNKSKSTGERK